MQMRFYKNGNAGLYKEIEETRYADDGSQYKEKVGYKVSLPFTTRCRICNNRLYTVEQNGAVTIHRSYCDDDLCETCGLTIGQRIFRNTVLKVQDTY